MCLPDISVPSSLWKKLSVLALIPCYMVLAFYGSVVCVIVFRVFKFFSFFLSFLSSEQPPGVRPMFLVFFVILFSVVLICLHLSFLLRLFFGRSSRMVFVVSNRLSLDYFPSHFHHCISQSAFFWDLFGHFVLQPFPSCSVLEFHFTVVYALLFFLLEILILILARFNIWYVSPSAPLMLLDSIILLLCLLLFDLFLFCHRLISKFLCVSAQIWWTWYCWQQVVPQV